MTTWRDFVNFVDRTYKCEILNDGLLKLVFNTSNLRSRLGRRVVQGELAYREVDSAAGHVCGATS